MNIFYKQIIWAAQAAFIALICFSTARAAGEVDTTFNASAYNSSANPPGFIYTTTVQPDGKILVGGNFSAINGVARTGLARLNADGTLDASFDPPDLLDTTPKYGGTVNSIALQSNGKILVGGDFMVFGSVYRSLIRLNPNGSLDASLVNDRILGVIKDIVVLPDDRFYLNAGNFRRFNSDGSTDTTFTGNFSVNSFAVQSDGKVIGADLNVIRFLNNGVVDSTFSIATANLRISKVAIQPDGKIIIGGAFTTVNGFQQRYLSRLNPDGSLDVTFNVNGAGADSYVNDIIVGADGKIYISGSFTQYNNVSRFGVARLNADGTLDTTFISPFTAPQNVPDISVQSDGKVLIALRSEFQALNLLFRVNTDGTADLSFNNQALGSGGIVYDVIQQPDGKVIAAGRFLTANGVSRLAVARYNADGTLDAGFNVTSGIRSDAYIFKVALQADGKILIGGSLTGVVRLNSDGSRDTGFTPPPPLNGIVYPIYDIDVSADGKILVNGTYRLLTNGALDGTFNTPSEFTQNSTVRSAVIQPDGKILVGGSFNAVNGVTRGKIARLNSDGILDPSFNPPFGANGTVNEIALQPNGKVVLVGEFGGLNGVNRPYVGRLNGDGSLDANFNPIPDAPLYAVKAQPDGKILIGGKMTVVNGAVRYGYARLNGDGSLDNSLTAAPGAAIYDSPLNNPVGFAANVLRINLQSDGKILLGGLFSEINNVSKLHLARLLNQPARPLFDFDGDGRADVAVFRPSNGVWYLLRSQDNSFYGVQFGQSGDKIAPADYDGDGRADIAVFRDNIPGAGVFANFYILNSADNSFRSVQFGATGDVPVSGDWDGDGRGDLAVYREAQNAGGQSYFFYRPSSQPGADFRAIPWGTNGDKPVMGDYDGDGKLDAAVYRPTANAQWLVLKSSNGSVIQQQFGVSTDIPVPADYDGDGITNFAVFRPSTGYWYTSTNPATNYGGVQFGQTGDVPVPADYDGDGRADIAVYRPSAGAWYLLRSQAGFTGVQFGIGEDRPIPNAFVR